MRLTSELTELARSFFPRLVPFLRGSTSIPYLDDPI